MALKKAKPIYIYDESESVINKAIEHLNKSRGKRDSKVTFSNFAEKCMIEKANEILKEIEKKGQ